MANLDKILGELTPDTTGKLICWFAVILLVVTAFSNLPQNADFVIILFLVGVSFATQEFYLRDILKINEKEIDAKIKQELEKKHAITRWIKILILIILALFVLAI